MVMARANYGPEVLRRRKFLQFDFEKWTFLCCVEYGFCRQIEEAKNVQLMLLLFKSCHSQWILFGNIFAFRFPAVVGDGFAVCRWVNRKWDWMLRRTSSSYTVESLFGAGGTNTECDQDWLVYWMEDATAKVWRHRRQPVSERGPSPWWLAHKWLGWHEDDTKECRCKGVNGCLPDCNVESRKFNSISVCKQYCEKSSEKSSQASSLFVGQQGNGI